MNSEPFKNNVHIFNWQITEYDYFCLQKKKNK